MSAVGVDRWGLRTLMTQTLDPAYAAAARDGRRQTKRGQVVVLVVVLIAGVVLGVAARHHQTQASDREAARAALIDRINKRNSQLDALLAQQATLRAQIAQMQSDALGSTTAGTELLTKLRAQELQAGITAVTGPGIVITIGDAAPQTGNDPVGHGQTVSQEGHVTDTDLQRAVNALWASGAEAIAINKQRIGPTTAIRQAGGAVLIDFRPVASPFRIEVIGNSGTLPADFAATEPARRFSTYRAAYGAEYDVTTVDKLALPAASEPVVAGKGATNGG